jgi:hypothetical protein
VELAERMALTVEGQATWANPDMAAKCISCRHIQRHVKPRPFKPDQCKLVWLLTRRQGVPFDARKAIACSKYEM